MTRRRKGLKLDPLTRLVTEPYQVENESFSNGHGNWWHLRALTNERYPLKRDDSIYVVVKGYDNEDFDFYPNESDKDKLGGQEIMTYIQRTSYTVGDIAEGRINARDICNEHIKFHPNYDIRSVQIGRKTGTTINP